MALKKILIIGIDSEIGHALKKLLLQNGFIVEGTSRKKNQLPNGVSFFDLKEPSFKFIDKHFDCVIICAAITNISECEKQSFESEKVNVKNTIKLIVNATKNNSFVVFLSSNSVFDGTKPFYKHTDKTNPKNQYGKFKNSVEEFIKNNKDACILRLTKVISKKTPIIKNWENQLAQGNSIVAYTNKFLSPVSIDNVVNSIQILINKKQNGIFQLGGSKEVSYFEFAQSYFKKSPNLLKLIKADKDIMNDNRKKFNSLKTYLPIKDSASIIKN